MSPIDFTSFQAILPDQSRVLRRLQDWADKHPDKVLVEPGRVAHELGDLSILEVIIVLSDLAERGAMREVLRVRSPTDRTLLDQDFESIEDIPGELADARHVPFRVEDAEVVPVFNSIRALKAIGTNSSRIQWLSTDWFSR